MNPSVIPHPRIRRCSNSPPLHTREAGAIATDPQGYCPPPFPAESTSPLPEHSPPSPPHPARFAPPAQAFHGATALHAAAYHGHGGVAAALLEARAQPDLLNAHGRRAVEYALDQGHATVFELLLDRRA